MNSLPTCTFLNNIGETPSSIDSPLQMKLINFLGLKNYMIENFIFKRKPSSTCYKNIQYFIRNRNNQNVLFVDEEYQPPPGYRIQLHIIETSSHSIPVCRLVPIRRSNRSAIIYAHGNASDMADSLSFVQRLSQRIHTEFIIFDYTGYGESRVRDVGEEIICRDLEILLAWATETIKLKNIIIWGFSLGTFPVVMAASKYQVGGVILQCPIASVSCMFHGDLHPQMKFKQDHFANIDLIAQIKSKIFIMHSSADEIIPFSHSKLLYMKYINKNGERNIDFVEVGKIKHNSLHKYIVSPIDNDLQKEVFKFISDILHKSAVQVFRSSQNATSLKSLATNISHDLHFNFQQQVETQGTNMIPSGGSTVRESIRTQSKLFQQLSQNQLKQIRMTITHASIPKISEDMQQLVVNIDQKQQQSNTNNSVDLQKQKQKMEQEEKRQRTKKQYSQWKELPHSNSKLRLSQMKIRQKINNKIIGNCFCFPQN